MGWLTVLGTLGKNAVQGFQKAKSIMQRQGSKAKPAQAKKEPDAKAKPKAEKATETKDDKVHSQAEKAAEGLNQKGMVKGAEDATGQDIAPSPSPNTNNGGGNEPHRGRSLYHDSHYQSPQNSHDQGIEV